MSRWERSAGGGRHYCEHCKCWMSGDPQSIKHHESGNRHRENVREQLERRRKRRDRTKKDDARTLKILRDAEKAANAQIGQDVTSGYISNHGSFNPGGGQRRGDVQHGRSPRREPRRDADERKEGNEGETQYVVDGQVYLQGTMCEASIGTGVRCEVWSEDADEWIAAKIIRADVRHVPNTNVVVRRYTAACYVPETFQVLEDESSGKVYYYDTASGTTTWTRPIVTHVRRVFEVALKSEDEARESARDDQQRCTLSTRSTMDVSSDQIRLCPAPPPVSSVAESGKSSTCVQSMSGSQHVRGAMIGKWESVVEDEESTMDSNEVVSLTTTSVENPSSEPSKVEFIKDPKIGTTDAYETFNPWGGAYRGIEIAEDSSTTEGANRLGTLQDDHINNNESAPLVAFSKKRKKKKKRKRNMRVPSSSS